MYMHILQIEKVFLYIKLPNLIRSRSITSWISNPKSHLLQSTFYENVLHAFFATKNYMERMFYIFKEANFLDEMKSLVKTLQYAYTYVVSDFFYQSRRLL